MYTKDYLLNLNYFIDNEWFEKYYELISTKSCEKEAFITNSHHIIPRHYFSKNNMNIDNTKENLVELKFRDHLLAHLYLSACTTGQDRYWNIYAICMMSGHTLTEDNLKDLQDIQSLAIYQTMYRDAISAAPNHRLGTKVSEETHNNMKLAQQRRVQEYGAPNKDYTWINDGKKEKMVNKLDVDKYLNTGYYLGRLFKHSEQWKAEQSERNRKRTITDEFRLKMSDIAKNSAFANPALITAERKKKNSDWHKQLIGEKNPFYGKKHSKDTLDKISNAKKGRITVNKNKIIKMILPEELDKYLQDGWRRGRK